MHWLQLTQWMSQLLLWCGVVFGVDVSLSWREQIIVVLLVIDHDDSSVGIVGLGSLTAAHLLIVELELALGWVLPLLCGAAVVGFILRTVANPEIAHRHYFELLIEFVRGSGLRRGRGGITPRIPRHQGLVHGLTWLLA